MKSRGNFNLESEVKEAIFYLASLFGVKDPTKITLPEIKWSDHDFGYFSPRFKVIGISFVEEGSEYKEIGEESGHYLFNLVNERVSTPSKSAKNIGDAYYSIFLNEATSNLAGLVYSRCKGENAKFNNASKAEYFYPKIDEKSFSWRLFSYGSKWTPKETAEHLRKMASRDGGILADRMFQRGDAKIEEISRMSIDIFKQFLMEYHRNGQLK